MLAIMLVGVVLTAVRLRQNSSSGKSIRCAAWRMPSEGDSMYALMLLQASADDVVREMERLQRNFTFLNCGLWVAWLVLVVYVLMIVSRERKLKREIAGLKAMLEDKPRGRQRQVGQTIGLCRLSTSRSHDRPQSDGLSYGRGSCSCGGVAPMAPAAPK